MDLKNTASGLLIVAASIASAFPAAAFLIECNTCTAQTAPHAAMIGEGRFLVANFATGEGWAFHSAIAQARTDQEGVFEVLRWSVTPTTLTSTEQSEIRRIAEYWKDNGGQLNYFREFRPDEPGYPAEIPTTLSAFDVVQAVQSRDAVGRVLVAPAWLRQHPRLEQAVQTIGSMIMDSRLGNVPVARIKVFFRDGTSAEFIITPDTTNQARYVEGSARDRVGNLIPDESHQLGTMGANQFFFDRSSDFQAMLNHFRAAGIPVHDPNGLGHGGFTAWIQNIGNNQRVRIRCEHDSGGGASRCVVEIIPSIGF